MISFDFDGIEEIERSLYKAQEQYPDLAEKMLRREQREFKKKMEEETWNKVNKKTGNLTKGFRFSKIQSFHGDIETDFYAEGGKRNPHFHLINNGHEHITPVTRKGRRLKNGGKKIGFVPGRRIKEVVIEKWRDGYEERAEDMLRRICEEANK